MLRNQSQGRLSRASVWVARLLLPVVLVMCFSIPVVAATYVTANGHVYLRKSASTDSDIVLVLQPNDRLKVIGTNGDWYNVEFGRKSGYVRNDVVTAEGESASSSSSSSTSSSTSTPAATSTTTYTTLQNGSTGKEVYALQEALIYAGYFDAMPDSKYGDSTESAIKAFQEANGLKADGIAGEDTQRKLYGDPAVQAASEEDTSENVAADGSYTTLRYGDTGDDVKNMQVKLIELGYLSGSATGRFRSDTRKAVKLFQEKNSVTADGIAGKKTLALLYGSNPVAKNPGQTTIVTADETSGSLKVGSTGDAVRTLQARLIELKYLTGSADGSFGEKTAAALRSFQQANGLTVDGVAGDKTLAALYNTSTTPTGTTTSGTLKRDSTGDDVKKMQTQLASLKYYTGSITGNFGSLTEKAVIAFQKANGLTADGIAGKSTLTKLYGGSAVSGNESTTTANSGSSSSSGSTPAASLVQNVNWYSGIRGKYKAGTTVTVYDFSTGLSWKCRFMSMGKHADSDPLTSQDTEIMYRAFGNKNTWTPKAVWITMPDGNVYIASLHNMPHLSGGIKDNNFDGHLCIHFPRTMSEAEATGPYAVSHQQAIQTGWEKTQELAGK